VDGKHKKSGTGIDGYVAEDGEALTAKEQKQLAEDKKVRYQTV